MIRFAVIFLSVLMLTGAKEPGSEKSLVNTLWTPVAELAQTIVTAVGGSTDVLTASDVAASKLCRIDPERELVIRDLSVVNDQRAHGAGPWSLGTLISACAPEETDPADFAENWMRLWIETAAANSHDFYNSTLDSASHPDPQAAADRAAGLEQFLSNWPRRADGKLDLTQAPFRLLSVVNRLDIHEGRLSFSGIVVNRQAYPDRDLGDVLDLAVILEYELPPLGLDGTEQDSFWWASQWHQLADFPLGSPRYLDALEKLTLRYTGRGVLPTGINGSALKRLRTNEQSTDGGFGLGVDPVWQAIGFLLSPTSADLTVEELADTPHFDYNAFTCGDDDTDLCQEVLIDYLLEYQTEILDGTWRLDADQMFPAIYGPEFPTTFSWLSQVETPEGLSDDDWYQLRVSFSNRTCNGCHSSGRGYPPNMIIPPHEFMHVSERNALEASALSPFLNQQIQDVRIPNMLSYIAPRDPRARRADPARMAAH